MKSILQVNLKAAILGTAAAMVMAGAGAQAGLAAGYTLPVDAPVSGAIVRVADDQVKGAENFVDSMAGRAIAFLGDDKISAAQKRGSFKKLLEDSFDMATIGRFALGTYWKSATEAQRAEYQRQFKAMVVTVYSERFTEYTDQTFRTTGARAEGKKDVLVSSVIESASGQNPVRVDWRVRNKGGSYKIVDVIVEGVSMSLTQRSDFSSVIQSGGGDVDVLLAHLKKRNG